MSFFVVAYDIPDNRRRLRISRLLEGFGRRIQKSVFECDLNRDCWQRLRLELAALADPVEDKVRFYPLCGQDMAFALAWDKAGFPAMQRVWVV
ncbi:MAG: CRISPR-associated endonuclease Cas2 [Azoarcus sp.]|nr:CRISPR-associated endonuclease Cas2 [Azoarcus sp.]